MILFKISNKEHKLGHALALGSVFIWSSLYVSVKILLEVFNPLELLFFTIDFGVYYFVDCKAKNFQNFIK